MFHLLEWTSPYDEKEDNASLPTHTYLNLWPVLFQSKLTLTLHAHSNKTTLRFEEFCIFSSVASVSCHLPAHCSMVSLMGLMS